MNKLAAKYLKWVSIVYILAGALGFLASISLYIPSLGFLFFFLGFAGIFLLNFIIYPLVFLDPIFHVDSIPCRNLNDLGTQLCHFSQNGIGIIGLSLVALILGLLSYKSIVWVIKGNIFGDLVWIFNIFLGAVIVALNFYINGTGASVIGLAWLLSYILAYIFLVYYK